MINMSKTNKKLPFIITGIYILFVIALAFLSFIFENSRTCFVISPYWNYGPIKLPCFFFDTMFKSFLNPSFTLLAFSPMMVKLPTHYYFLFAIILNSLLIYAIMVFIIKLMSKRKINSRTILLPILLISLLLGIIIFSFYKNNILNGGGKINNTEYSDFFSIKYPDDFSIKQKNSNLFVVAEKRWEGNISHVPEAGVRVYNNVILDNMSLRDWLNGVGNPTPPVGDLETPKSCKEFLDGLRQQLKYGDLISDEYLKGTNCIYLGVSNINDKTVAGFPALEFNTQNVSSGATHTIFVYKNQADSNLLFDIYFTVTGMSDDKDQTIEAYKLFLNTFKLRQK